MNDDVKVEDAEIADEVEVVDPLAEEGEVPNAVKTQLSIENLIKSYISQIKRYTDELKPLKEMVSDLLENSEEYRVASAAAKEASTKKGAVKKQILSTPEGKAAESKLNEMKEQFREAQESLSTYLAEYQRLTGLNEIEGEDGELRKIVYVAKLVRKTNLER